MATPGRPSFATRKTGPMRTLGTCVEPKAGTKGRERCGGTVTAAPTHGGQSVQSHCHRCGFEDWEHINGAQLAADYPEANK